MKAVLLTIFTLVAGLHSKGLGKINAPQFQCSLALEITPLTYIFVTHAVSVRIKLISSCLRLRDFVFEGFYTFKRRLSPRRHPRTLVIKIFDNKYKIRFSRRRLTDTKTILRKYKYNRVTLLSSKRKSAKNVDCESFNNFLLDEGEPGTFSVRRIQNILFANNPIKCRISRSLRTMFCNLV